MRHQIPLLPRPTRSIGALALAAALVVAAPAVASTLAPHQASCVKTVAIGDLASTASGCFTRDGLVWVTTGDVDFGGLTIKATSRARFVADPFNARVAARGYRAQASGVFSGLPIAGINVINSGNFDIAFQQTDQTDASVKFIGTTGGKRITLGTIEKLPGLAGVQDLPQATDPDGKALVGFPDYSRVSEAKVQELQASGRIPSGVTGESVEVPLEVMGLPALEPLVFQLPPQAGQLLGLELDGRAELLPMKMDDRFGLQVTANAELKGTRFDGIQGNAVFFIAPGGYFSFESFSMEAGKVEIGSVVRLQPVSFSYDKAQGSFAATTTVFLPSLFGNTRGLGADVRVKDGKLQRFGLVVPAAIPVATTGTEITTLQGSVDWEPVFKLQGGGTIETIAKVGKAQTAAVSFDKANIAYTAASPTDPKDPWKVTASGDWLVLGEKFGTSSAEITSERLKMGLDLDFAVKQAKVKGQINGYIGWKPNFGASMDGNVDLRWGTWSIGAKAMVSVGKQGDMVTGGVAACGTLRTSFKWLNFDVGGGYLWNEKKFKFLDRSCDLSAFRVDIEQAKPTQPTPEGSFGVYVDPPDTGDYKAIAIRLKGVNGQAPEVTAVTGNDTNDNAPSSDRYRVETRGLADRSKPVIERDGYVIAKDTEAGMTTIIIPRPAIRTQTRGEFVRWATKTYILVNTAPDDRFKDNPEIAYVMDAPTVEGSIDDGKIQVASDVPAPPPPGDRPRGSNSAQEMAVENGLLARRNPIVSLHEEGPGVSRLIRRYAERDAQRPGNDPDALDLSAGFTPAPGPPGLRRIVARVEEYGLVREEKVIDTFRFDGTRLERPEVSVTRTGDTTAVVRWTGVPNATGYRVALGYNGDVDVDNVGPRQRSMVVRDLVPESPLRVTVRATGNYPAFGPADSADAPGWAAAQAVR